MDDKKMDGIEETADNSMTNETVDVVKRTLELSETIIEAIDHIITRLSVDDFEQGAAMLSTIGDGMESIEKTFPVILNESFVDPEVSEKCSNLFLEAADVFEAAVSAVVDGDLDELRARCFELQTAYKVWDDAANLHLRKISIM